MKAALKEDGLFFITVGLVLAIAFTLAIYASYFYFVKPNPDNITPTSTRFMLNDAVAYNAPSFYSRVCSGHGVISDLIVDSIDDPGNAIYEVQTPGEEEQCPHVFRLYGKDLLLIKRF